MESKGRSDYNCDYNFNESNEVLSPEFRRDIQEIVSKARKSGVILIDSSIYSTVEQIRHTKNKLKARYTKENPAKTVLVTDNIWTSQMLKQCDSNNTMIVICVLPLTNSDKSSLLNVHAND